MQIRMDRVIRVKTDQNVLFTLVDDNLNEYPFHGDCPLEADPNVWFNSKVEEIYLLIKNKLRQKQGIELEFDEGGNDVAPEPDMTKWISTHPKESEVEMLKKRLALLEAKVR
jgi:hypothetical protein